MNVFFWLQAILFSIGVILQVLAVIRAYRSRTPIAPSVCLQKPIDFSVPDETAAVDTKEAVTPLVEVARIPDHPVSAIRKERASSVRPALLMKTEKVHFIS